MTTFAQTHVYDYSCQLYGEFWNNLRQNSQATYTNIVDSLETLHTKKLLLPAHICWSYIKMRQGSVFLDAVYNTK